MAKSKTKFNFSLIPVLCGVVGIVALILFMFLPIMTYSAGDTTVTHQGLGMIFGGNIDVVTTSKKVIGEGVNSSKAVFEDVAFNFMTFLPWLFTLVGAVLLVASQFVKQLNNKLIKFVGGGLLITAAIFMFIMSDSTAKLIYGEDGYAIMTLRDSSFGLAAGSIIAAILNIIAGGGAIALLILKKD